MCDEVLKKEEDARELMLKPFKISKASPGIIVEHIRVTSTSVYQSFLGSNIIC